MLYLLLTSYPPPPCGRCEVAEGDADVNCTLGEYSSTMLWGNEADPPRLVQTHPVLVCRGTLAAEPYSPVEADLSTSHAARSGHTLGMFAAYVAP